MVSASSACLETNNTASRTLFVAPAVSSLRCRCRRLNFFCNSRASCESLSDSVAISDRCAKLNVVIFSKATASNTPLDNSDFAVGATKPSSLSRYAMRLCINCCACPLAAISSFAASIASSSLPHLLARRLADRAIAIANGANLHVVAAFGKQAVAENLFRQVADHQFPIPLCPPRAAPRA